jgi:hypothetical protein
VRSRAEDGGGLDHDLIEAGLSEAAGCRLTYGESVCPSGAEALLRTLRGEP